MNRMCSPNTWRFSTNHSATTISTVQIACTEIWSCHAIEFGSPKLPTMYCHTLLSSAPRNA